MTEQRMVPVELLEDCIREAGYVENYGLIRRLRSIIDGTGVELPPQSPKQAKTMLICDGEDVSPAEVGHWFSPEYISELLASPSAPVARCHECGKLASDGWALYCGECAEKIAPEQAVPDGVVEALQSLKEQVASILCHKLGHPGTAMAVQDAVIRLINRGIAAALAKIKEAS